MKCEKGKKRWKITVDGKNDLKIKWFLCDIIECELMERVFYRHKKKKNGITLNENRKKVQVNYFIVLNVMRYTLFIVRIYHFRFFLCGFHLRQYNRWSAECFSYTPHTFCFAHNFVITVARMNIILGMSAK